MRYLIIERNVEGNLLVRQADEWTFKDLHKITNKQASIFRFNGKGSFEALIVPNDWTKGDLEWLEVRQV